MDLEPNWCLTAPGVLALDGTQFKIKYQAHVSDLVYHDGRSPASWGTYRTIDAAKQRAALLAQDMRAMGIDP